MATASSLPASAMQASRAAVSAAMAEVKDVNGSNDATKGSPEVTNGDNLEDGEIQEVDMESQAEGIRTVFSDPTNFNVKVRSEPSPLSHRVGWTDDHPPAWLRF